MLSLTLLLLALLAPSALANPLPTHPLIVAVARELRQAELEGRVLEKKQIACSVLGIGCDGNSLNTAQDGYAPWNVTCPTDVTWIRKANGLSTHETTYLTLLAPSLSSSWSSQTTRLSLPAPPRTPVVAVSLSGGGYRAMLSGSGGAFLKNTSQSSVGDLMGLSSYVAGLSGGSWATGSFYANDGGEPDGLIKNLWNLQSNLIFPSDNKVSFFTDLYSDVQDKQDQGFETQITDYWGGALVLPAEYHLSSHPNFTITHLNTLPKLANHSLPYPIIVAAEREPGEVVIAANATLWEFTMGEFGTWGWGSVNKTEGAFTPVQYLGTNMTNAQPTQTNQCWNGFDNLAFIMGTSSTLFNSALLTLNSTDTSSLNALENAALGVIEDVLKGLSSSGDDIALYPNPFCGWEDSSLNPTTALRNLQLVDAGETNQNLPVEPFLIPYRGVDCIIALDSSADTTYSWPNGSALHTTFDRAAYFATNFPNATLSMPRVPSTNGFVNGGLNQRPTFFGCNDTTTPVVVYIPSYPWSYAANTSTFMLSYTEEQALGVVYNGKRSLELNGTISDWPQCLTCAMTYNSIHEANATWPAECQSCFSRFCWNGVDNTTTPTTEYAPTVGVAPQFIINDRNYTGGSSGTTPAAAPSTSASATPNRSTSGAGKMEATRDVLAALALTILGMVVM